MVVLVDWISGRLPYPAPGLLILAFLSMAAWCFYAGQRAVELKERGLVVWDWIARLWIIAALVSVAIGVWQFFRPEGAYPWIAALSSHGRVFANIRQPNHMATMLGVGWVLLFWLGEQRAEIRRWLMILATCFLMAGIAMTGSRTGAMTVISISALLPVYLRWRGQPFGWTLLFPIAYGIAWLTLAWVNQTGLYESFGVERMRQLPGGADVTGARLDAWLATWDMILKNPLTGVGTGRFGFFYIMGNWSRPASLQFGHAHNIALHLAAEHGIAVMLFILGCIGFYCVLCLRRIHRDNPFWIAFFLPVPVLIHSQFEFPLWYSYFLLPTFFALGSLASRPSRESTEVASNDKFPAHGIKFVALILLVAPCLLLWSNLKMQGIYFPNDVPLSKRIQLAQGSFLFKHYSDHALLSTAPPELTNSPAVGTVYSAVAQVLTDVGLLSSWTIHSAMNGRIEQAKRMAFALWSLDQDSFGKLRDRVKDANDPELAELAVYMANPTPINYPIELLLRGEASTK